MADKGFEQTQAESSGLEPEAISVLESFVGKRLASYAQAPNAGNFDIGDWRDDEPLLLTFEDGTVLSVRASGFHGSGGLSVDRG